MCGSFFGGSWNGSLKCLFRRTWNILLRLDLMEKGGTGMQHVIHCRSSRSSSSSSSSSRTCAIPRCQGILLDPCRTSSSSSFTSRAWFVGMIHGVCCRIGRRRFHNITGWNGC